MTKIRKTIPSKISVGGQTIKVELVGKLEGSFQLGECSATGSYIKIANNTENMPQSNQSKRNTFWHECIHLILDAMGEYKLNQSERFVSSFAGFLNEMTKNAVFLEEKRNGGLTYEEFDKQD